MVVESEPVFAAWWIDGRSLGDRAGGEAPLDLAVGVVGTLLVLEATRRAVGWALPALAAAFLVYGHAGPWLPSWLLPHRGYGVERLAAQTFLGGQGVFGIALSVMFTYVFLFILFGALLEATGATGFITAFARRVFRRSPGGPAKVSVLASGLLGSLSGSAVANTATTGTFTIPMMRSAGFPRHLAAGIEAAASSGGALMPPVMGAGAYMMLELVSPPVTYLTVIRAALLPAMLYYLSLFAVVHFQARRLGAVAEAAGGEAATAGGDEPEEREVPARGLLFAGALAALLVFLLTGASPSRAVTLACAVVLAGSLASPATRLGPRRLLDALVKTARDAVPLIAAGACVGIVLAVVTLTGAGQRLPALVVPLAQENLLGGLALIMAASLVLGMGLPSAVCYLLIATLVGPALGAVGVEPLAAHLFIFYFGMMSMVTPPVALAAYTAASIAGAPIMRTSWTAFRVALVGFTLPYIFVFRPELLLLDPAAEAPAVIWAVLVAAAGILAFAAGLAGYLRRPLGAVERGAFLLAAALLLAPVGTLDLLGRTLPASDLAGGLLLAGLVAVPWHRRQRAQPIK